MSADRAVERRSLRPKAFGDTLIIGAHHGQLGGLPCVTRNRVSSTASTTRHDSGETAWPRRITVADASRVRHCITRPLKMTTTLHVDRQIYNRIPTFTTLFHEVGTRCKYEWTPSCKGEIQWI
jgi:hypothetical protein